MFTRFLSSLLIIFFCLTVASLAHAVPALSPEQSTELKRLYQSYAEANQAAQTARQQAELLQSDISSFMSRQDALRDEAAHAEADLMELQDFERKKPGRVKPEELDAARKRNVQAKDAIDKAQQQLDQKKLKLNQATQDFSARSIESEHRLSIYRSRFNEVAAAIAAKREKGYKISQQVTESARVACEDLSIAACKSKTQQEAQRRAIEKGAVIVVDSITEIKNLKLEKDVVRSEVFGEISNYQVLESKLTDEPATYYMKIQATVTPLIGDALQAEIMRTVRADMSAQIGDGGVADAASSGNAIAPLAEKTCVTPAMAGNEFSRLLRAAEKGDAQAQYDLAVMYDYGVCVRVDYAQAVDWYGKAAAQGHAAAQAGLGWKYYTGSGVRPDVAKAIALFKKGAARGDALSLLGLWQANRQGKHAVKDDKESAKLAASALAAVKQAAQSGDHVVQRSLADLYREGMGVEQDEAEAAKLYEASATQGNVVAANALGLLNVKGRDLANVQIKSEGGTTAGIGKAVGNTVGSSLSWVGAKIFGSPEGEAGGDDAKASEWFEKAALQGYGPAQRNIGVMYLNGWGVNRDDVLGYAWLNVAALQGEKVSNLLTAINLTPAEKLEAELLASSWKPGKVLRRNGN